MGTKRKMLLIEVDTSVPNKELTGADTIFLLGNIDSPGSQIILDASIIQIHVNFAKQKGGRTNAKKK